ncbi:MAG TPA: hypothetical protein DCZ94_22620 [Lentisphaeria bacterium]|nr:MAG: hypothetical protein A2X48_13865 [Lentisphaerae bacterium GWF2_49_21]HBC89743.1 hypothetical protein [Lentisphaeria bacterium]
MLSNRHVPKLLYASTIFVSSFLLFLVQPIIAKQILPWFGGSVAVWTTCLLFFQLALLGGYAYSDLSSRLKPQVQSTLHIALLIASLASLPIIAGMGWKPEGEEEPILRILGLLAITIGLPYFMLSTTGPLVQSWFAREHVNDSTAKRVYRFFALSNFGSMLGLLSYPFAIEMFVSTRIQAWVWSVSYAVFVVLCVASALCSLSSGLTNSPVIEEKDASTCTTPVSGKAPALGDYLLWLSLAALGSLLLMAISTHITQNIASVPLLWVLPLTLYLLSFVLCFGGREGHGLYERCFLLLPMLFVLGVMALLLNANDGIMSIDAVSLYCGGLFLCCMFCHGELAHAKPAPKYLTRFYLMISAGGAIGGLFVCLLASRLFNNYWELPLGFTACALMAVFVTIKMQNRPLDVIFPIAALAATGVCSYCFYSYGNFRNDETILASRNFYGVLCVRQIMPGNYSETKRQLMHGVIMHGEQYTSPNSHKIITSYYGRSSGIGMVLSSIRPVEQNVGVVGLGTGTLAGYGETGDRIRFYEINPQVVDIARKYFYYLKESRAKIEIALGDARLVLEREPSQRFDVLAVDAFSSDAIPVHLITREALKVYLRHIKPDGAVAFHVTNRYLNLAPVVKLLADEVGMEAVLISDSPATPFAHTDWVIVTQNRSFLSDPDVMKKRGKIETIPGLTPWTDDFNNLFRILK